MKKGKKWLGRGMGILMTSAMVVLDTMGPLGGIMAAQANPVEEEGTESIISYIKIPESFFPNSLESMSPEDISTVELLIYDDDYSELGEEGLIWNVEWLENSAPMDSEQEFAGSEAYTAVLSAMIDESGSWGAAEHDISVDSPMDILPKTSVYYEEDGYRYIEIEWGSLANTICSIVIDVPLGGVGETLTRTNLLSVQTGMFLYEDIDYEECWLNVGIFDDSMSTSDYVDLWKSGAHVYDPDSVYTEGETYTYGLRFQLPEGMELNSSFIFMNESCQRCCLAHCLDEDSVYLFFGFEGYDPISENSEPILTYDSAEGYSDSVPTADPVVKAYPFTDAIVSSETKWIPIDASWAGTGDEIEPIDLSFGWIDGLFLDDGCYIYQNDILASWESAEALETDEPLESRDYVVATEVILKDGLVEDYCKITKNGDYALLVYSVPEENKVVFLQYFYPGPEDDGPVEEESYISYIYGDPIFPQTDQTISSSAYIVAIADECWLGEGYWNVLWFENDSTDPMTEGQVFETGNVYTALLSLPMDETGSWADSGEYFLDFDSFILQPETVIYYEENETRYIKMTWGNLNQTIYSVTFDMLPNVIGEPLTYSKEIIATGPMVVSKLTYEDCWINVDFSEGDVDVESLAKMWQNNENIYSQDAVYTVGENYVYGFKFTTPEDLILSEQFSVGNMYITSQFDGWTSYQENDVTYVFYIFDGYCPVSEKASVFSLKLSGCEVGDTPKNVEINTYPMEDAIVSSETKWIPVDSSWSGSGSEMEYWDWDFFYNDFYGIWLDGTYIDIYDILANWENAIPVADDEELDENSYVVVTEVTVDENFWEEYPSAFATGGCTTGGIGYSVPEKNKVVFLQTVVLEEGYEAYMAPDMLDWYQEEIEGKPTLTWYLPEDAIGYNVYRVDPMTGEEICVCSGENDGQSRYYFEDELIPVGVEVGYYVTAVYSDGSEYWSETYYHTILPTVRCQTTVEKDGIQISWNSVEGADGYHLCVFDIYDHRISLDIPSDQTSWFFDEAESGNFYEVSVAAYIDIISFDFETGETYVSGTQYSPAAPLLAAFFDEPVVKADNTNGGVNLSWNEVPGADSYVVYMREGSGSWKVVDSNVNAGTTSYKVTGLTAGKTYRFTVRAAASLMGNTYMSSFTATSALTFLPRTTVTLTNGVDGVNVSWTKVTGANDYQVYRKVSGGSWTLLATPDSSKTSYVDKTAVDGTTYYYAVRARAKDGSRSDYASNYSILYLKAPVVSGKIDGNSIAISWNKVSNAKEYQIYRKNVGGSWTLIKTVNSSTLTYTDSTASAGNDYYYTVRAKNGDVRSDYAAYGPITLLSVPKFTAAVSDNSVNISWDKVNKASGYYVYRRTQTSGWSRIATTSSTSYSDKSAVSGTTYYYTVRAYNADSTSDFKTGSALMYLAMPTFKTTVMTNGVEVSWSKVSGATEMEVYRRSAGGSWTKLTTVSASSTGYLDKTAVSGTTYSYTVRAKNGTNRSDFTASAALKYLTAPKVSNLLGTSKGVTVAWNKVSGAEGYYVYRKTSGGWSQVGKVSSGSTVSFTDSSAVSGTTYTYTVRAYSGSERSDFYSGSTIKYTGR